MLAENRLGVVPPTEMKMNGTPVNGHKLNGDAHPASTSNILTGEPTQRKKPDFRPVPLDNLPGFQNHVAFEVFNVLEQHNKAMRRPDTLAHDNRPLLLAAEREGHRRAILRREITEPKVRTKEAHAPLNIGRIYFEDRGEAIVVYGAPTAKPGNSRVSY